MITTYQRTIKDKRLKTLTSFKSGSWINVENPSKEEIEKLSSDLNLDIGLLNDAIDPYEVPRFENYEGTVYVYVRFPYSENNEMKTAPLLIAINPKFVLTVGLKKAPFVEKLIEGKIDFYTTQENKFFLQLFSQINHLYTSSLLHIRKKVSQGKVRLEEVREKDILQFVFFESTLNEYISALIPTNAILNHFLGSKTFNLYESDQDLIEDLRLSNLQLIESCKSNLNTIVNIRQAYSVIITNNLNRVIRVLTVFTIILTIPTMITSFFGMNVGLPLENFPNAAWLILAFTTVFCLGLWGLFVKNKWL